MYDLYQILLTIHGIAGAIGLAIFWRPVLARKGGADHRRLGAWFARLMQLAGVTAVAMTLLLYIAPLQVRDGLALEPAQQQALLEQARRLADLLLPLGLLLLANTRHGVLVLRARLDRSLLRQPSHQVLVAALTLAGAYLLSQAWQFGGVLQWVFGGLCLGNAVSMWRYLYKPELRPGEWVIAHLGNLLGAGIAAHTAFLVFGGRSFLQHWVPEEMQLLLWIAPSAIGGLAITVLSVVYRRRLGGRRRAPAKEASLAAYPAREA